MKIKQSKSYTEKIEKKLRNSSFVRLDSVGCEKDHLTSILKSNGLSMNNTHISSIILLLKGSLGIAANDFCRVEKEETVCCSLVFYALMENKWTYSLLYLNLLASH